MSLDIEQNDYNPNASRYVSVAVPQEDLREKGVWLVPS
jgi:hypothetical protein